MRKQNRQIVKNNYIKFDTHTTKVTMESFSNDIHAILQELKESEEQAGDLISVVKQLNKQMNFSKYALKIDCFF